MMKNMIPLLIFCVFLIHTHASADETSSFLHEKPGGWTLKYTIQAKTPDEIQFKKNVAELSEWFRRSIPILAQPKGFNMQVAVTGSWDEYYRMSGANYGSRADMTFYFQLFMKDGRIWTAELPSASYYGFSINATNGAMNYHGTFPYFSNVNDNPKREKAINAAASKMDEVRIVFPFREERAPGVHVYENPGSSGYNVIVFNPKRPAYWLPVTVKELAAIYLEYYALRPSDQLLFQELKNEIARIQEDELSAPAFMGHDSNIVFRVNGKSQGLPLMRFNPDYWDRSLPPSAIQFMTSWYPQMSNEDMAAHLTRFGYPVRSQILVNQIDWNGVAGQIMKRK
jgi:hypothetical protein